MFYNLQKCLQVQLSKPRKGSSQQLLIPSYLKNPKKLSSLAFDQTLDRHTPNGCRGEGATLSDIDCFLFENFNSLYSNKSDDEDENPSGFQFESPKLFDPPPDDLRPSNRFFVSPVSSNSLIKEALSRASIFDEFGSCSSSTIKEPFTEPFKMKGFELHSDSVAVLTDTRDPYEDFRRSMQEMVEARQGQCQAIDWDFMEELLFSYLELNERNSYKYILDAFVDLILILRRNDGWMTVKSRKSPATGEKRRKGYGSLE